MLRISVRVSYRLPRPTHHDLAAETLAQTVRGVSVSDSHHETLHCVTMSPLALDALQLHIHQQ